MPKGPVKLDAVKNATADGSVYALEPTSFIDPERMSDGPKADGQAKWSSLKQRQKGEPVLTKSSYTADEVSEIVKHAVAEALKAVNQASMESRKEKKEVGEVKVGGK